VLRRSIEPKQYLAIRYTERLAEAGVVNSVGSKGDCLFTGYYDWTESERSLGNLQDVAA
jgi:hypothetical protein